MPSLASHVHRRGGVYHLRCRVPKDLVNIIGRQEIRRSLGTASPSDAKVQAAKLYVRVNDVFEKIRRMDNPKDELIHLLMELSDLERDVGERQLSNERTKRRIEETKRLTTEARQTEMDGSGSSWSGRASTRSRRPRRRWLRRNRPRWP